MNLDQRLSELAKQVGSLQTQVSREEGQLEALQDQRARIIDTCKSLDIKPEQLDAVIAEKERELDELLTGIDIELAQIEKKRGVILENTGTTAETG